MARLIMVVVCVLSLASPALGQKPGCFDIVELKRSFTVVFPTSVQIVLDEIDTEIYLGAYNSFGRPTRYQGDSMLLIQHVNGVVMAIPLKGGVGCARLLVGPKLHKAIMTKVGGHST